MRFSVYVLYSPNWIETYVGQSDDVEKRIQKHNAGRVRSTKSYRPWILLHVETFESRAEAVRREKWFKMPTGRKFIADLVSRWNEGGGLSDPTVLGRGLVHR
ncbi:MAG: GIY-YIG nuclease family protein [Ignavibacteriales bacterium]|nr:GIY-YIG nuclease family protein [Ignavibacteriales bacterium]